MLRRLFDSALDPAAVAPRVDPEVAALCLQLGALARRLSEDPEPDPLLDPAVVAELFRNGLFSLTVPRAAGGLDASLEDFVLAMEQTGRMGPAYAMTAVPHLCISVKSIARLCDPQRARAILEDIRRNQRLLSFAITEDTGSDIASLSARLHRAADGSLRLDGRKQWITNLRRASHVVVVALCPDLHPAPGATALVCVALSQAGVSVGNEWIKHCANGSDTADLYFDSVAIAPEQLLGSPGQGLPLFHEMVQSGRLGAAAACVGLARTALEVAANDPATPLHAIRLRDLETRLDLLSRTLALTARRGDAADPQFAALTALAKHGCSTAAQTVIGEIDLAYAGAFRTAPPAVTRALRAIGLLRLLKGPGEIIALQAVSTWLWRVGTETPDPAWPRMLQVAFRNLNRSFSVLAESGGPSADPVANSRLCDTSAAAWMLLAAIAAGKGNTDPCIRAAWRIFRAAARRFEHRPFVSAPAAAAAYARLQQARQQGLLAPSVLGDTSWQSAAATQSSPSSCLELWS